MKTIDIRQISKIPEIRRVEGPKDSYKCLFCQNKPKSNLGREKKHIHFIQHMQICNGNRGKFYKEILRKNLLHGQLELGTLISNES